MAWKQVDKYYLGYNAGTKQFMFYYSLQGDAAVRQFFPDPPAFVALSEMFRNEGPISYNTDGDYFVTGPEAVGEAESPP
jgi:hypothetical protein